MTQKQPEDIQKDVVKLKEWILEKKLPPDLESKQLLRFLHSSYYDVENAKGVIELFFKIRTASADVLTDRDPLSPEIQTIINITRLALFHNSENKNIWIWSLNDPGMRNYNYVASVKLFLLMTDVWLLEDNPLEEEDIIIMDVKDVSLRMLMLMNMSIANRCHKYQQDALPIRLKQIHAINVSPVFYKIFSIVKPFINKEVKEKINFHLPQSETIFNFLRKEDLPEEFGGTNGTLEEHTKRIVDGILRNRESLIRTDLWNAGNWKSLPKESTDVNQSIQTLEID